MPSLPVAHLRCTKCNHAYDVEAATVDSDGGAYFGSAYDFCPKCDGAPVETGRSGVSLRVFVYWNIHKNRWSIKALSGPQRGRVVQHANAVELVDCELRVSEAGRQRVLREQRKNVHAGIVGTLVEARSDVERLDSHLTYGSTRVIYNPYRFANFVAADDNLHPCVRRASRVWMDSGRSVHALDASA